MRAENYLSAAHATDVADIDCSKSKTRFCKHILILMIFSQLENVFVCPTDVATNRWHKTNEIYNECSE